MTQTEEAIHAEPVEELDIRLHRIKTQHAIIAAEVRKSWLNIANDDEAAFVDVMGGHFLTSRPEEQSRYFTISETAKDDIERATNELHGLFMHATDYVLQNEELLAKFNLPAVIIPKIRQSWDNRLNEIITSRFDFALTQDGLKVYEYNCDSASCFMEAGKVQGKWAKAYGVKDGDDAGQDLFNDLVDAWKKSQAKGLVHILRDEDLEEVYHANFMREAILAAGLDCCIVVGNQGLVWGGDGNIFDEQGQQVKWVWKTWAWETALDQIREECNVNGDEEAPYEPQSSPGSIPRLSDVLFQKNVMVFEPLWSLIPSNKAILPVLWALFPNHHNLLNSSFELSEELLESGYVTKPIVGRCGSNISLRDHQDTFLESTGGNFEDQETIFQQLFALPRIEDYYVQICAFTAAGIYAGSCVRVDTSMIINQESDCLPLRVNEDAVFLSKT
jgi:glutathionylspermidine amidase/synthetase